jgi:hypothetical protein
MMTPCELPSLRRGVVIIDMRPDRLARCFEQGEISAERARSFTYVAFKKIREELRRGREDG